MFGAVIRVEGAAFPEETMAVFPSDFKGAYLQMPACPEQALRFTVVT